MGNRAHPNQPAPRGCPTESRLLMFVMDGDVIPVSLDESIDRIVALQNERKLLNAKIDNLKAVAKLHLKKLEVTEYEAPSGHSAKYSSKQMPKYDKEAILELTGEDFALCVSFTNVTAFTVK